jgi:hypothetical protein
MNSLFLVVLYSPRSNTKLRVFLTAENEGDAKRRAIDEWGGREDRADMVEFLCHTPDTVNKGI